MTLEKILYTAKAHTTGGREGGSSRTDDGRLDVKISSPGGPGAGTNPEQLPADVAVDAEIDLGTTHGAFGLAARLNVSLPGMDRQAAQALVEAAHQVCPYSNATRGNIDVTLIVV